MEENIKIVFCNSNDKEYQKKLNELLKDIFLDFKFWYDVNLWDDNYESYSITVDDKIVSNICIYKAKIRFSGKEHLALSVGAVATHEDYRGQGLSRKLMEHIIDKYQDIPMYLSANSSVVDFYPRFGFERAFEKLPTCHINIENHINPIKLHYNDDRVQRYVYSRTNFSDEFDCLNTASVNMFHLHLGYLHHCIYELPDLSTMLVAEQNGTTLHVYGVFSTKKITFRELLEYLPFEGIKKMTFGFTPCWKDIEYTMEECETDPWFVRGINCDLGDIKFPELSIT